MNLHHLLKKTEKVVVDNSPAILTAIGVTGVVTTAYLTGKASIRAVRVIEENEKKGGVYVTSLSPREKFEKVWKLYIPAAATGLITIASIIGANRIGTRRAAAVAAAYSLSEKAWGEYRDKVVERLGEKTEQTVRDEVAQERINRDPVGEREVIITGKGDVLCYDSISGRYFESNVEALRKVENDINHQILNDMHATLYEFYDKIGLSPTPYSSEVGWNCDNLLELRFSATLTEDQRPCMCLEYVVFPTRDYHLLH